MSEIARLETTINGNPYIGAVDPNVWLLDFVRDELELRGTKRSCEVQVCGVCTVLVNGEPVSSCCYLAADVHGKEVTTIEGLVGTPLYEQLREAMMAHAAVQCGFCTPGLVTTLISLKSSEEPFNRESLAHALRGTLCRCTGYKSLLEAGLNFLDGDS